MSCFANQFYQNGSSSTNKVVHRVETKRPTSLRKWSRTKWDLACESDTWTHYSHHVFTQSSQTVKLDLDVSAYIYWCNCIYSYKHVSSRIYMAPLLKNYRTDLVQFAKVFVFNYCSIFVFIWQILSNHGVTKLKRFISRFIVKLCN